MQKGFTLIETFVAITILLIAVLGPMSLFAQSISDGIFAKNQVTAFYLAQEGVELTINKIYSNIKQHNHEFSDDPGETPTNWLSDLENCLNSNCQVEFDTNSEAYDFPACNNADNQCDYLNFSNNVYNYDAGSPTSFRREIKITRESDSPFAVLEVIVHWKNKLIDKQVTLSRRVYDLGQSLDE